jgi:nuclear pore complex protein Nup155
VTPKPDTFTNSVSYLLVVATPVEVCLLAVVRDEGVERPDTNYFPLISIQPTRYSTPSDNLTFVSVVGTASGRIFMAGSDNYMYEFQYSNEESSWMHYLGVGADFRCKKQRVDVKWMSTLTSIFGNGGDSLVDLAVDNPRQLLYAVSKNGKLSAFRLDDDRITPIQVDWNVIEKARAKGVVLNVSVISVEESAQLHGVVILSSGARIYFSVLAAGGVPYCPYRTGPPTTLEFVCNRLPPSFNV